ncbi:MAG: WYL domain-containing protein [Candidatus Thiodiazotropha lotti]|nr:WYL domain-containing protein [Candidatus Thiodiazotropha lotti]
MKKRASSPDVFADLKWEVRQRLAFVEATLIWSGEVSTGDLINAFGIGRAQASKDLALYQEECPANLSYDRSRKRYVPTSNFEPRLVSGKPEELLRFARNTASEQQGAILLPLPAVLVLDTPEAPINVRVLQMLNQSIRQKSSVIFGYRSMSGKPMRQCDLSPHTLVHNGYRWHVRGFSHVHGEFRDFVLSRFTGVPTPSKSKHMGIENDEAWQQEVEIHLGPHPALDKNQKRVVESDYGMRNGIRKLKYRAPVIPYLLRLMRIPIDAADLSPRSYPIVVRNLDAVRPYLAFSEQATPSAN